MFCEYFFSGTRIFNNVWAETFQLRFGASETVARPDLREVSAATYIDPLTEARVIGNPNLVTSPIKNFDARAEWFFENGDNFTASVFYKDIERPIETVQGAGSDDNIVLTFTNAQSAEVQGLEVEWLKDLSALGPDFFEPFFFSGNITLSTVPGGSTSLAFVSTRPDASPAASTVAPTRTCPSLIRRCTCDRDSPASSEASA